MDLDEAKIPIARSLVSLEAAIPFSSPGPFGPTPTLEGFATRLIDPIEDGPPDLVPGLVPTRGEVVIAGETNVGKSLMALEIVSSLVTGLPLWGELKPNSRVKKVLYVLGEHYVEVIQRLHRFTKLPMTDQVFLLGPEQLGYDKWLVTGGKPNLLAINKFKKWADGCDLIVWDPLAAFVTGSEAENDNIGMRLVLDSMSLVAQSVGASCIVLAHQGKPSIGHDGKEYARTKYAIRGASAIEDAATNIFYFGKAKGESDAAQGITDGNIYALTCRKYKGVAPTDYKLLRDKETLTHRLLGSRPFIEVRRFVIEADAVRLMKAVPDITKADLVKILSVIHKLSDDTVRRALAGE